MAEISIIIPVYNTEKFLCRCIDSVLLQTFKNFELLLVDDGSVDNSRVICEEYSKKDERIHIFHQKNQGQAVARNRALDWIFTNSESQYISFVDSDDWIHPRYLELLMKGIKSFNASICQCRYVKTGGEIQQSSVCGDIKCLLPNEQYIHYYSAYMCDKLFLKNCWQSIRFPEGQIYEDLAVWYKILFSQEKIAFVDAELYYYFINPDSTVHQDWRSARFARVEAWGNQVDFFTKKSKELFENSLMHYCQVLKEEYYYIEESRAISKQEAKHYQDLIEKRVHQLVKQYRRIVKKDPNYNWFLELEHPLVFACYWKLNSILNKRNKRNN